MAEPNRYRIAALSKGLEVLGLFSERRPRMRVKEIADATGIPLPTTFRLIATLEEAGFIERAADGAVGPGINVLNLGFSALAGSSLLQLATPITEKLAQDTGRTVNLGVLMRDEVMYLIRHRADDLVTENLTVGSTLPAPYTSLGKVLLAFLDEAELERIVDELRFPPGAGPNALRSVKELRGALDVVRADGYAVQDEEAAAGLRSVAAPVRGADGRVIAALNIACPAWQTTANELRTKYRNDVVEAAQRISGRIGHRDF